MNFTLNGYDHDGILLNLSGYRDEDECVIQLVTVDGNPQDLSELIPLHTLEAMALKADAQLSSEYRAERVEQRAELRQWQRDMACA